MRAKKTSLRFQIGKGNKVLATAKVTLSKKKAKVVIRPKRQEGQVHAADHARADRRHDDR